MTAKRSRLAIRGPGWLGVATLTVAVGLGCLAATSHPQAEAPEAWTVLVQTGDELAAGEVTATVDGQPLTAGKAYLLAFHHAQDAGDLEHVLAVADRLEAAGEGDLAAHVRRAAGVLVEELGR